MTARNTFSLLAIVVALVVVATFAGLRLRASGDVVDARYDDHAAALRVQAFEHGMIPDFLPRSAVNIRSVRNIDLNETVVTFGFGADFDAFIAHQGASATPSDADIAAIRADLIDVSNRDALALVRCVATADADSRGRLLIDRARRRAVFVSPGRRSPCDAASPTR